MFSLIKTKRLMLLTETTAVVRVAGNIRNTLHGHSTESLNVKAGGTYRYNRA